MLPSDTDTERSQIAWDFTNSWQDLYKFYGEQIEMARQDPSGQLLPIRLVKALEDAGITGDRLVHTFARVFNGFTTVAPVMDVCIDQLLRSPDIVQRCLESPGTVVLPSLEGALNDPAAVDKPNEFNSNQKANRSLVFGGGPH